MVQSVTILGATGSIGQSTLKVLAQHPERYRLFAVTAQQRLPELLSICQQFNPQVVVLPSEQVDQFAHMLAAAHLQHIEILKDQAGLIEVAAHAQTDIVMAAIVGAAGLMPTLAAVQAGKRVLLANKEALVMSGEIMMQSAQRYHATLLPVDSEHNAIFQCLPQHYAQQSRNGQPQMGVSQVLLTASGGPFLNLSKAQLAQVTPAQACKHPNWSMGQKISVDSATLMNKGLELIEACHLFALAEHFVTVVVHPQSIVHSMVQYVDGSTLAQLGNPDMCTPIAHALAWPERITTQVAPLDFMQCSTLNFQAPDHDRFPCLNLARQAIRAGGTAPSILNAANEIAVNAFLQQHIGFMDIAQVVDATLDHLATQSVHSIEDVLTADTSAREVAQNLVSRLGLQS